MTRSRSRSHSRSRSRSHSHSHSRSRSRPRRSPGIEPEEATRRLHGAEPLGKNVGAGRTAAPFGLRYFVAHMGENASALASAGAPFGRKSHRQLANRVHEVIWRDRDAAGVFDVGQPCEQLAVDFLELQLRHAFADTDMRAKAERNVFRRVGAPDIEPVGIWKNGRVAMLRT